MIEFKEDGKIKQKIYLSGCIVGENNWQLIIVITHDKYTISANNGIKRTWTRVGNIFLWPKSCRQDIMTFWARKKAIK